MNIDDFWLIIEATRASTKEEQLELFRRKLERLTPQELVEIERIFIERLFAGYRWDLWLVAWLCQGGMCSDDGFHDFRAWLISRGRNVYEAALENADSLVDEMRQAEDPEFETFAYVPGRVYQDITGQDFPELEIQHPGEPNGGDWLQPRLKDRTGSKMLNRCIVFNEMGTEEFTLIERRFPRVWELCVQRGIIAQEPHRTVSNIPTPEQIAATVDPNLAPNDFGAYLNALGEAARQVYRKKN